MKYYSKWLHLIKYEMIIFNIIGVTPFLILLFLLLNFTFCGDNYVNDYKIMEVRTTDNSGRNFSIVLENNALSNTKLVEINTPDPTFYSGTHYRVTLAKGLFGYDIIKGLTFVRK